MARPELLQALGEANLELQEVQIRARRERKRRGKVSPETSAALRAAEARRADALAACGDVAGDERDGGAS